jgi:F-type H+-transporting ATPase subunit gamma
MKKLQLWWFMYGDSFLLLTLLSNLVAKNRLKSTQSIQKITASMKMVAAAKLRQAQKSLEAGYAYETASANPVKSFDVEDWKPKNRLIIAVTSDRGLCGAANTYVNKSVNKLLAEDASNDVKSSLFVIGEKGKALVARNHPHLLTYAVDGVQKGGLNYSAAAHIASLAISTGSYDAITLVHNHFVSMIAYETTTKVLPSQNALEASQEKDAAYEIETVDEGLECYQEMRLADGLYSALCDSATAEQSSRMTSMENATKNAGEMISALQIKYNRTRQAVITTELIEIISGAASLDKAK